MGSKTRCEKRKVHPTYPWKGYAMPTTESTELGASWGAATSFVKKAAKSVSKAATSAANSASKAASSAVSGAKTYATKKVKEAATKILTMCINVLKEKVPDAVPLTPLLHALVPHIVNLDAKGIRKTLKEDWHSLAELSGVPVSGSKMLAFLRVVVPKTMVKTVMTMLREAREKVDPSYRPADAYQRVCDMAKRVMPLSLNPAKDHKTRFFVPANFIQHDHTWDRPIPGKDQEWITFYLVRANRLWFRGPNNPGLQDGYLDADGFDKPESLPAMWTTCLDDALKSATQEKKLDHFNQYVQNKCGSKKLHNMLILPENGCTSRVRVKLSRCSTCCCPFGLMTSAVRHELLFGAQTECGTWFALGDSLVRQTIGFMRAGMTVTNFDRSCFAEATDTRAWILKATEQHCADDSPKAYIGTCHGAKTVEACQKVCQQTNGCKYVSWTTDENGYGNMYKVCSSLKKHDGRSVYELASQRKCDLRSYKHVFNGSCKDKSGKEIRMYDGSSDNPGTPAEQAKKCSAACVNKKKPTFGSWTGFTAKGFIVNVSPESNGRCYCESEASATCKRKKSSSWKRYDWTSDGN